MDMRDDSYMARYFDDLERELALVFEDIKDDGDRDDVVRQLQDYVMYQNSVLSMSPLACVKYYEAAKSSYIAGSGSEAAGFSGSVVKEWDRQGEYTSYVMPATDTIHAAVPRVKVTDFSTDGDTAKLGIYEWMTIGYAPKESTAVSATAYGYNFSLNVERDRKGSWMISSVDDTDQNFDWMEQEAILHKLQFSL